VFSKRKKINASLIVLLVVSIGWALSVVPASAEEPVSGGVLKIGYFTAGRGTTYLAAASSVDTKMLVSNALDTLIAKDPLTAEYYPGLAESWNISSDGREIILYLRKDVTFHDGTPFNAQAVKANFDHMATSPETMGKGGYNKLGFERELQSYEVIDNYTFKITYNKLFARMLENLTDTFACGMNSPTAMEKYGEDYGQTIMVGTGPFKLVEWTGAHGKMVFERNEEYNWAPEFYDHQGPPYLEGFIVYGMVEPTPRSAALEIGEIDMAALAPVDFMYIREIPGFKEWIEPKKGWGDISVNLTNPILQSLKVRQAISHAIDREAINNSPIFQGLGEIKYCEFRSALWGKTEEGMKEEFGKFGCPYNPDKARALLEKVGWKDMDGDGVREAHGVEGVEDGTRLHLFASVAQEWGALYEIVQAMLADVGIEVEVRLYDMSTWDQMAFEGNFDITPWNAGGQTLFGFYEEVYSTSIPYYNIMHYNSPLVDACLDAAVATTDPQLQKEYFRLVAIQVLKDLASIPLVQDQSLWIMKDTIEGVKPDLQSIGFDLYDAWINPNP